MSKPKIKNNALKNKTKNKLNIKNNKKLKINFKRKLKNTLNQSTKKIGKKKQILTNFDLLIFSIKFFLIFFTLSFIIEFLDLSIMSNFLTIIVSSILNLPFLDNQIFLNEKIFVISNACLGFSTISILFALIFSLKKPELIKKMSLFIFGAGFIFLINIPRLVVVVFSEIIGFDPDLVHTLTWFFMSLVVLVIFLLATKYYYKKELNELV